MIPVSCAAERHQAAKPEKAAEKKDEKILGWAWMYNLGIILR